MCTALQVGYLVSKDMKVSLSKLTLKSSKVKLDITGKKGNRQTCGYSQNATQQMFLPHVSGGIDSLITTQM